MQHVGSCVLLKRHVEGLFLFVLSMLGFAGSAGNCFAGFAGFAGSVCGSLLINGACMLTADVCIYAPLSAEQHLVLRQGMLCGVMWSHGAPFPRLLPLHLCCCLASIAASGACLLLGACGACLLLAGC